MTTTPKKNHQWRQQPNYHKENNMSKEQTVEYVPSIYITPRVYKRIFQYADACSLEISGFGQLSKDGVFDTLFPLFPQECTATETEIHEGALFALANSRYSAKVRVWWHSHVNMGVFWSTTDVECISALGQNLPYLLSVVVNKKGEYEARVDYFHPIRVMKKVELEFFFPASQADDDKVKQEVEENVKPKVFKPTEKDWSVRRGRDYFGDLGQAGQEAFFPVGENHRGGLTEAERKELNESQPVYHFPKNGMRGFPRQEQMDKGTVSFLLSNGYELKDGILVRKD